MNQKIFIINYHKNHKINTGIGTVPNNKLLWARYRYLVYPAVDGGVQYAGDEEGLYVPGLNVQLAGDEGDLYPGVGTNQLYQHL